MPWAYPVYGALHGVALRSLVKPRPYFGRNLIRTGAVVTAALSQDWIRPVRNTKNWNYWWVACLAAALAWLAGTTPLQAQDRQVSDDEVNAVAKQLFCPVCQSEPLDVCGTLACRDWREEIRTQLSQGATEQQVIEYFAERYGDRVRAEPRFSGAGLVVWLVPIAALLIAGWYFVRYLQRIQTPVTPTSESVSAGSMPAVDEYAQRIEDEVKN